MSLEQYHGFEPSRGANLFSRVGLRMVIHSRFEMGLYYLLFFNNP